MKTIKMISWAGFLILFILTMFLPTFNPSMRNLQAQTIPTFYFPIFSHYQQPLYSTSYYLTTVDDSFIYNLGCALGTRDQNEPGAQDSVAVLDFSFPVCSEEDGFGADLFNYGPISLPEVKQAVRQFANGYYTCSGSDNDSNLVIGVGTNNKPISCDTHEKAAAHGSAWSDMVSEINQQMFSDGIFHQVQAYGASDIELGWNTPEWTRAWLGGFEQNGENLLLHFGDASGCPYEDKPWYTCGTSAFPEWTLEDVWFVSWGSPSALPLPLIYLTSGVHAKQWAYLSQYSVNQHGYRMDFTGVFTQSQYCDQFSWCDGTDNTPFEAYMQMENELAKYETTQQSLHWKTDIRWILPSEVSLAAIPSKLLAAENLQHPIYTEIDKLKASLELENLSPLMANSLQTKLDIYETIAANIELSKLDPASK